MCSFLVGGEYTLSAGESNEVKSNQQ